MESILSDFLERYCPGREIMLLGLSGGPDSIALFHLLLKVGYPFEVAHLDHGWREESQQEASALAQLCIKKKIPFHVQRLNTPKGQKNLEEAGREARHRFFKQIIKLRGLRGVFLAHHADDQAETVLKRIFEGATLPKLSGLIPSKELDGLLLLRPFLKIRKEKIINWLEDNHLTYFQDATNRDLKFLRGRLRERLIPTLSSHFGKEIASGLCRIGESAGELSHFLDELLLPYLQRIEKSEGVWRLDFSQAPYPHLYLWKMVVARFFHLQNIAVSQHLIDTIITHLRKNSCRKVLRVNKHKISIDRGQLLLLLHPHFGRYGNPHIGCSGKGR